MPRTLPGSASHFLLMHHAKMFEEPYIMTMDPADIAVTTHELFEPPRVSPT